MASICFGSAYNKSSTFPCSTKYFSKNLIRLIRVFTVFWDHKSCFSAEKIFQLKHFLIMNLQVPITVCRAKWPFGRHPRRSAASTTSASIALFILATWLDTEASLDKRKRFTGKPFKLRPATVKPTTKSGSLNPSCRGPITISQLFSFTSEA